MLALALLLAVADPLPPMLHEELIVVDDRLVKGQVPGAVVLHTIDDIHARTGVTVTALSMLKDVDDATKKKLDACADKKCLAELGRKLKADAVLMLRVTESEGVLVVTVSRIAALAKIKDREETALARAPSEIASAVDHAVKLVFPTAPGAPPAPPPPAPAPRLGGLDEFGCREEGDAMSDPAPSPFSACPAKINTVRPLPVFDEGLTKERRKAAPKACCYRLLGNR